MKVLQINAVNGIRSTGRAVDETSQYLNEQGIENFVAYSYGFNPQKGYKIGNIVDRKMHAFFSKLFGLQGYYSIISTLGLIKYIKKIKPSIIHLGNLHSNFINLKILFKYIIKNNIPTVITLHDCWFYTGKCTHYTLDNCNKWEIECYKCPRLHKDNVSWIFDRTKKMFYDKMKMLNLISRLAIIGVSDWITNEAKKSFLSSSSIITRIYNWIDTDKFKPLNYSNLRKSLKIDDKFIILGVASLWSSAKGLNSFIELSKNVTQEDVIILVGKLSRNCKLPENIIHIQETNNIDELVQYYSSADCFLNLSYEETFGKTVAESLSCGTPAVVLNSTACPELIGYNCGIVIDKLSISNLVNSIKIIKNNKKSFYTEYCRKFALANFKKEDRLNDMLKLYNDLSNM